MSAPAELCHCGKPLHYTSKSLETFVRELAAKLGTHRVVRVGDRAWLVPRHYIALHGIKAQELPNLGFEEILPDGN